MTRERRAGVLLVDDEPDNLVALTAVLEPLDRELVQAGSGEQALALLLKREFAVILLDVRMPGLDGFETAALIKQRQRTRQIPIIFVTAVSRDTEHVFRGYSEGAVDYLLKPFTEERVGQCTERLVERFRGRGPTAASARIVARRGSGLVFLDRDEVWAFEASERLTFVHTPHGTFDLELSLSAIEASFGDVLKRVHRSWLVHSAQVRSRPL